MLILIKTLIVQNIFYLIILLTFCSCGANTPVDTDVNSDSTIVDSVSWFKTKVDKEPGNLNLLFERAKFYVRKNRVEDAQVDLETYLSRDSSNLKVHVLYADIMMAALNLEKGKYHYEYVIGKDSLNTAAYLGMGRMYAILDNNAAALFYLNKSLMIDPYQSEPYFMKGMIYRSDFMQTGRQESWDMALTSFQTAIEQDPDNYSAYIQLGVMYDQLGDSTAVDYYNSALDIYPESMEAWYNKGMFYQTRGKIDEAFSCYRTINSIDSTWAEPYYNQGYLHLLVTKEFDSAIYYFDRAVTFDPEFYQAYNNMGLAYEEKEDYVSARYYYTKAIELNPDFKLAKDNLNRLIK